MIDIEKAGEVWTVTLNRPDKANALTQDMLAQLVDVMRAARDTRAVILTGAGNTFSAGADLEAARAGLATSPLWEELSAAIVALRGYSIAALNGTLAGGAFGMALACDTRIAPPHARFFYPVMKHGFLPQPSDPPRMAALIGPSKTKLVLMGAQKLQAEEALQVGLIDRIVPSEAIMETALSLTDAIVNAPDKTAFAIKQMCP